MYGKECSKNVWKQLLEPTYTPNQNLPKTSRPVNPKKSIEKTSRSTPNTHQDKFSTQNYSKADVLKTLMPYMYDPEKRDENYSQSVIVMPVRVYHDNFKTNEPPIKLANPSKPSLSAMKKVSASPSKEIKFLKKGEWSPPKISKRKTLI